MSSRPSSSGTPRPISPTFKQGLQFFDFGSQNWGYADVAGNIAYFASGEFPIREDIDAGTLHGNPPYLIRDGTGGNEWKALGGPQPADQAVPYEIVPTAQMPQIENPPAHFWVNANNDPIGNTADNDALERGARRYRAVPRASGTTSSAPRASPSSSRAS